MAKQTIDSFILEVIYREDYETVPTTVDEHIAAPCFSIEAAPTRCERIIVNYKPQSDKATRQVVAQQVVSKMLQNGLLGYRIVEKNMYFNNPSEGDN